MNIRVGFFVLCAVAAVAPVNAQPTYSKEVSRIIQAKCQQCHRPDDIAPFALLKYEDASAWAEDIGRVVENKIMPPWKPVAGHGEFKDNFGLSADERKTILDWVAAGAPEGEKSDLPEPLATTGPWQIGEPDMVVTMPEAYDVPRRKDVYRCFVLPTGIDADKYVSAVQILPGNRQIVHHVLLFLDSSGQAEKLDAKDEGPGYECFGGVGIDTNGTFGFGGGVSLSGLGAWVPGSRVPVLPDGVGILVPKTARIIMQVHYFPNGRPGPDQTKVGLYFAKKAVKSQLLYVPVVNTTFKLQPGDQMRSVEASLTLPPLVDAKAYQIIPHMHLLGKTIKVQVTDKNTTRDMIQIDDWDFNWQNLYSFAEPMTIKSGSTVKLTCTYDNSEQNPRNPSNPLRVVGWGEGTEDEMCLAFIGATIELFGSVSLSMLQ